MSVEGKRPISGFFVRKIDVKTWAGIITLILATGGIFVALMSTYYWTRGEATDHNLEFVEHKTRADERHKAQVRRDKKIDRMDRNISRLGVRWRIRDLERVEEDE